MTRIAGAAVLACALAVATAAADMSGIVDPYLKIQAALAADSMTGVKEQASAIAGETAKLGVDAAAIGQGARALQGAGDVASARTAFSTLTNAILDYAEKTGSSLGSTKIAYCPMEKKYWVQQSGQIENPYGGKKMLRCGEFVPARKRS